LERARHVEALVRKREARRARLLDGEAAAARPLEHRGREIHAARGSRERRDMAQQKARAAADLEHVATSAEALDEAELELVDQVVVAAWIVAVAAVLVARGELFVVRARLGEVFRAFFIHPVPYTNIT